MALADDHPLFREGLRKVLSMASELDLIGEAADGEAALELCRRLHPDILVLDVSMPRCDGFGVLAELPKAAPQTRAIMLTVHLEREVEERALAGGARGFLQKDSSAATILRAIRAVAGGQVWASRFAASRILSAAAPRMPVDTLTARESEMLAFLGRGMMNREIAEKTGLSEKTVASHVASLVAKLGVRGRLEAAMLARRYARSRPSRKRDGGEGP
ncbi:MAG: response regulator transcription factor [Acidobacteriota bacterium]